MRVPKSIRSTTLDPWTRENGVWLVASLTLVQLDQRMPCNYLSHVPFSPSSFFLMPLRIFFLADSTCPFVCRRDTELYLSWMLKWSQNSIVHRLINCLPLSVMMTQGMPYLVRMFRQMNWQTCLSVMVLRDPTSTN